MKNDTINLSEKTKMLSNQYYVHADEELTQERAHAEKLLYKYNLEPSEVARNELLPKLIRNMGDGCTIKPPFKCDYGYNIELGDRVFLNYNCILLDCNTIRIGDDSLLAPGVQISAAYHPTDYTLRQQKLESAAPVTIGKNVWIGAGAIICPGVTIGDHVTIGAGSVVCSDIPSKTVAVGNPCRVIKKLD